MIKKITFLFILVCFFLHNQFLYATICNREAGRTARHDTLKTTSSNERKVEEVPPFIKSRSIKMINDFNRLFGDYYSVNENRVITSKTGAKDFMEFYYQVKDTNWSPRYSVDMDNENSLLKRSYPSIKIMNLKFTEGGIFYPEIKGTVSPGKRNRSSIITDTGKVTTSDGLYISPQVQSLYANYETIESKKQRQKDSLRKTILIENKKIDNQANDQLDAIKNRKEKKERENIYSEKQKQTERLARYNLLANRKIDSIANYEWNMEDEKIKKAIDEMAYTDENGRNLSDFADQIKDTIKKYRIKDIYFFAHGYNAPPALAQMQGNRLLNEIQEIHKEGMILFIRIFWEGGTNKKLVVRTKEDGNFLTKLKYKDKFSLQNAFGFRGKTKEAIKCGHSLRRLLSLLEKEKKIKDSCSFRLISHSLGGILMSNSLINDMSEICFKRKKLIKLTEETHYVLNDSWKRSADSLMNSVKCRSLLQLIFPTLYEKHKSRCTCLNKKRKRGFKAFLNEKIFKSRHCIREEKRALALENIRFIRYANLPDLKISVFMNAPAIPGVPLFQFANRTQKYRFTVGYNVCDPILAKRFIFKNRMRSGFMAFFFGNTSLGLNAFNEVGQTEFFFQSQQGCKLVFKGHRTSNFFEHDLFYYMQHPLFKRTFDEFIK